MYADLHLISLTLEVKLKVLLSQCYLLLSPFCVFRFSFFSSFNCFCFSLNNSNRLINNNVFIVLLHKKDNLLNLPVFLVFLLFPLTLQFSLFPLFSFLLYYTRHIRISFDAAVSTAGTILLSVSFAVLLL